MNADETGKAPTNGTFQPITDSAPPTSGAQPVRRAGVMPAQPEPGAAAVPASGSVPQRSAFRPTTAPGAPAPAANGTAPAAPTTGAKNTPPSIQPSRATSPTSFQPSSGAQPAGAAAAGATAVAATSAAATTTAAGTAPLPGTTAGGLTISDRFKGITGKAKDGARDQLEKADRTEVAQASSGPRKARVLVSRIDPWSALKMGFLLSIAAGIMLVVAVHVIWNVLNSMGTFDMMQDWISRLFTSGSELNILQFIEYSKVMSATLLIAVVNVVLITGLVTVTAFLYNIISRVVGGVYMTLTDD